MNKLCKVVMLPTEKVPEVNMLLLKDDNTLTHFDRTFYNIWKFHQGDGGDWKPSNASYQHLYIISNDEIKEASKCYDLAGKVVYAQEIDEGFASIGSGMACPVEQLRSIIASTDTTLNLPLLPESFIKKYVEENGEIDEALVEFEEYGDELGCDPAYYGLPSHRLKTREDNTIRILPAKTYTRKKVIQLLHYFADFIIPNTVQDHIKYDKWIEDNLK